MSPRKAGNLMSLDMAGLTEKQAEVLQTYLNAKEDSLLGIYEVRSYIIVKVEDKNGTERTRRVDAVKGRKAKKEKVPA